MGNIMGSAAKTEIGSANINYQDGLPLLTLPIDMGQPQPPPTKLQIYNTTAEAFSKIILKHK